jgi:hypothetical protein
MRLQDKIYINSEFKNMLWNMNCGPIDYITIYRIEGPKVFFSAGNGRFHATPEEIESYRKDAE